MGDQTHDLEVVGPSSESDGFMARMADLDQDGEMDILALAAGRKLTIHYGPLSDGATLEATNADAWSETDSWTWLAEPGDLDGDGELDLALGSPDDGGGSVTLLLAADQ